MVNLELADESPDDAEALRVVLAGEVPCRPHLEPARRARDPNVVLALLQRLQDEVGVRADHLHRGGHGGLQTAKTLSDPPVCLVKECGTSKMFLPPETHATKFHNHTDGYSLGIKL